MTSRARLPVGRFQVMATLQAARAHVLGMSMGVAKSWGLNRAIFFAAAKRGFIKTLPGPHKKPRTLTGVPAAKVAQVRRTYGTAFLGDDMAYRVRVGGRTRFVIGGSVQTPEAFRRQVEARFNGTFARAFREALSWVRPFGKDALASKNAFYAKVYKPRRDELAQRWSRLAGRAGKESR